MRVLLIGDDQALVAALAADLRTAGLDVESTESAAAARALAAQERPDLIMLSATLDGVSTLGLLVELRRDSHSTVIVLAGQGDEDARVRGLELGADDYVSMPCSVRELTARISALLQHRGQLPAAVPSRLRVGPLTLDVPTHTVEHDGRPVTLTVTEFRLLLYLMTHAGTVVTLSTLLREVWGYEDVSISDVVRTTVYRLRQKLRDDPAGPHLLHTVPGIGFLLRAEPMPPATNGGA